MTFQTLFAAAGADRAGNVHAAARALAAHLRRGRRLDRALVAEVMTTAFGATDAQGAWSWRDAYDAQEAAMVIELRRLAPQLARLEDAPAEVLALTSDLAALGLTHSRRSEAQVALDQFSSPPPVAALAVLAAQVRPGDRVLEPSAGTGLIAVLAEANGAVLTLNELAELRGQLLAALFPSAAHSRADARRLKDLLPGSGGFDVVLVNPPFQDLDAHLAGAIACLADEGRMVAVVPAPRLDDAADRLRPARLAGRIVLPAGAFARHGVGIDVGLLVVDRGPPTTAPDIVRCESWSAAADAVAAIPGRTSAKPRPFRGVTPGSLAARPRSAPGAAAHLAFLAEARALDYGIADWSVEGRDVGLYQAYAAARIVFPVARPHPSPLVESGPMASVAPPAPTHRPRLPLAILERSLLSDAQLEAVIYAGEAHAALLPGTWRLGDAAHLAVPVGPDDAAGLRFRRGFFIGDGTGCGKGREIAGVIVDNMAHGRMRAVWLTRNDALLEDTRRDWRAIGGAASDIVPQSVWRQGETIGLERGVLFSTYATLRQPARGARPSRLDQIVDWLGADFDGVIVFDEAHAMANATGGKGARGGKKPSLQGMAGLALQNRLPNARVLYVSATGATVPENLAYAARLGLWGGPDAPFATREAFLEAVDAGGVAMMELIARELKALGLYIARALSFEGVEYEPLRHALTDDDRAIWDAWADAYQLIHRNLRAALDAVGVTEDGKPRSALAASAAFSAFEAAKLRFFGHLLSGLKAPSLIAALRRDLCEGRSAVVQVVSTNEAVMERRLAQVPLEEWNNLSIDLTPKDQVLDYLTGAFPIHAMDAIEDEDGGVTLVPVRGPDGSPVVSQEALRLRDDLVARLASLPAVPGVLDSVLDALGADKVAEITGRSRRVLVRDGRRVVERRSASAGRAEAQAFMDGAKRVLVFSDAGGTGRSYHADLDAANRQRRVHYLVEPGWRADAAIQGLGRSHRTHQASAPLFRPVTTDIHGEKRFLSTIARRLDSLGALTRGERRTAGAGLFRAEDNLESPWAHRALVVFFAALHAGEIAAMTRDRFEELTGLRLTDAEGELKTPQDLPPMSTFLNRLLALRIADQNALFAAFDRILGGIIERAAAAGVLDRGLEDIVADHLVVSSDEVVRTDAASGAETRLVRFEVRTRRRLLSGADALAGVEAHVAQPVVNTRSGRAAIAVHGLTLVDDSDRLVEAVRLIRPVGRTMTPASAFAESRWEAAEIEAWRAAWDGELAAADPWAERTLILATGLLLPIWTRISARHATVRRVIAPDGRRWLGRVLDASQVDALRLALGLSDAATLLADASSAARLVLAEGAEIALAEGLWLRRARVMDRYRLEIVGGASHRDGLVQLGCFVEIIAYQPRVFAPTERAEVLSRLFARWPPQRILERAA